jgi:hypothetical protein
MSFGPSTDEHGSTRGFDGDGRLHGVYAWCGFEVWWKHGELHRDGDLPAVVHPDGFRQWWVNGVQQTPADRAQTRRWSALRAAFVGAVVAKTRL